MNSLNSEQTEAMFQLFQHRYEQIVEINLTSKYCKVIWSKGDYDEFFIDDLWDNHYLYPNDAKSLRKLRNSEYVKERIAENSSISLRFRRKDPTEKKFQWMQIEVVPNNDYREDNIDVLMFIKNIEDSYGKEYKARRDAERLAKTDSLTGYLNRHAYDKFCANCKCKSLGVAFIDLNGLKAVNDTEGHKAGDLYIQKCCSKINAAFSYYKKYRIGGDEFVVIAPDVDFSEFAAAVNHFNRSINENMLTMPICSVGHSWTEGNNIVISDVIATAEKKMYRCKEADYLRYNEDRRHSGDRRHNQ